MEIEQMRLRMGEMAAEIERLKSIIDAQQSPAVAVPDGLRELIAACRQIGFPVVTDGMRYVIDDMQSALSRVQNSIGVPSPRITEQDAREILEGFCKIWHYSSEIGAFLGDSDCRDILAKLNEANNGKAN
jgi:hypothetical protein